MQKYRLTTDLSLESRTQLLAIKAKEKRTVRAVLEILIEQRFKSLSLTEQKPAPFHYFLHAIHKRFGNSDFKSAQLIGLFDEEARLKSGLTETQINSARSLGKLIKGQLGRNYGSLYLTELPNSTARKRASVWQIKGSK